jgi:Common central domain of tyrosinase
VQEISDALNSGREGRTSMMLDILNPNSSRYPRLEDVASDLVMQNGSSVLQKGDLTDTVLSKETSGKSRDPDGKAATYGSIEGMHNNYHGLIGGSGGHMNHPSIAAFDPVFWMHHW